MHIYFLKLNVLDTPGQSVWNHDERKIPDKVKISFVNTFLFESILFIISVSKYTYIGKKAAHNMDTKAMLKNQETVVFDKLS